MAVGLKQLIAEARRTAREVPPEEAHRLAGEGALVVDVRESGEFRKGHIAGSKNVSRGLLELRAADDSPGADSELTARRSEHVLVYCTKSPSARSLLAAQTLAALGYEKVSVIDGGLDAWAEAGLPTEEGA